MQQERRRFLTIAGRMFVLTGAAALAWDNCPKGLVNDPYPGACRRYEDTNGDGICDLSQPEPAATTTTTEVVATSTTSTTKVMATVTTGPNSSNRKAFKLYPYGPSAGKPLGRTPANWAQTTVKLPSSAGTMSSQPTTSPAKLKPEL